jgi:hypothetical protein
MNNWQLGLLIWALVASGACLFIHGASVDDKGRRAKRDAEYRQAWADRISAKNLQ